MKKENATIKAFLPYSLLHNRLSTKRLLPWLVGIAILSLLLLRTDLTALRKAFTAGPWWWLAIYIVFQVPLVLAVDSLSTYSAFRLLGFRLRYPTVLNLRGASYLVGILSYGLGQGALALLLRRKGISSRGAFSAAVLLLTTSFGTLIVVASISFLFGPTTRQTHPALVNLCIAMLGAFLLYSTALPIFPAIPGLRRIFEPLHGVTMRTNAPRLSHGSPTRWSPLSTEVSHS